MGWACCGLQASPLFCFMQSRSAGCGRNAQARSTPLSKAFLADKLATSALLRLILTKPTQGCSSQGTQRPCGGSWEDAGAPSARLEPWRCPAVLQAACGAPPAQSSPRTGSPKGARRALAPPELPPSRGSGYTHNRRQMCAGCPARAAAAREGPGPAPHLPFERVVPAAVPSPLGPAGTALLGAHPLGVPGGGGTSLGRPQHGNSQGDPQQPPPPHRVPRALGLRAAAASSPPPKTAGPRRPVSDQPLQCELRGRKEEEEKSVTEEKRPRPPRAPRRLPPRPGAVGPRPARRYRGRERRRPRGMARGCPGPRGLCLPFSSIRGGSRTRRGQTAAAATVPEAAPGAGSVPWARTLPAPRAGHR